MKIALALVLLAACTHDAGARDAEAATDAEARTDAEAPTDAEASTDAEARPDAALAPSLPSCFRVTNARAPGGAPLTLGVRDGRVAEVDCEAVLDARGRTLVPAVIDSHVHLAYLPVSHELARGGVAAAIDLASPLAFFEVDVAPLRMVRAGPMIVAPLGYPTTSWGSGGYGVECSDADACAREVDGLLDRGAGVIKVSLGAGPDLDDASLLAIVARAHARGVRVAAHALTDEAAARAARVGCDVLAHAPTQRLSDATVSAWRDRAVISTLGAFGSDAAIDNVRRLREAGATILYGTDLGNARTAGIDARELQRLGLAGLDGAAILACATSAPAAYWGLDDLGALELGDAGSFLLLDGDPIEDPARLARPEVVVLDGHANP